MAAIDPFGADPALPPDMALDEPPVDLDAVVVDVVQWADDHSSDPTTVARDLAAAAADRAEGAEDRWRIESDDQAEWAMSLLAIASRAIAREADLYAGYRSRLERWHARATAKARVTVAFMSTHLERYALRRRDATDAATLNLPSGTVRTTLPTKPRFRLADSPDAHDALLAWARATLDAEHWSACVVVTEKVQLSELAKIVTLQESADGTVFVLYEGNPVAGVVGYWPQPTSKATPNVAVDQ